MVLLMRDGLVTAAPEAPDNPRRSQKASSSQERSSHSARISIPPKKRRTAVSSIKLALSLAEGQPWRGCNGAQGGPWLTIRANGVENDPLR